MPLNAVKREPVRILGIAYTHVVMPDGDELFLTEHGLPFLEQALGTDWYKSDTAFCPREKLRGTGTLYRLKTREAGLCPIDLVAKWCRVGQEAPGQDPEDSSEYAEAEFNSPFEEFALLSELRSSHRGGRTIRTHKPLGIYVPAASVDPELLGRKAYLFRQRTAVAGVELDLCRQYILIYEWIKGVDLVQASETVPIASGEIERLTLEAENELETQGFQDIDRKPHHLIVRIGPDRKLLTNRNKEILYARIDFEMLRRTPKSEAAVKTSRRREYLIRQRDRFNPAPDTAFPPNLHHVNVFGVDYVYGQVGSTGGALWVVGKDPQLFDYFLPERWRRTPRRKLSHASQIYYTLTKDDIHLVWRVSRVGEKPDIYPDDEHGQEVLAYGYNSPFEEFSIALELDGKGLRTIYPRAIYRTGTETHASVELADNRRYETHRGIVMPDGTQVLRPDRNFIAVWGYWNGPDELLAVRDGEFYSGVNLRHAYRDGVLSREESDELIRQERSRLLQAGVEDLYLRPEHFMVTHDHAGNLIRDREGRFELRICNFELLRRTSGGTDRRRGTE
jgi:hypothetical protein